MPWLCFSFQGNCFKPVNGEINGFPWQQRPTLTVYNTHPIAQSLGGDGHFRVNLAGAGAGRGGRREGGKGEGTRKVLGRRMYTGAN